MRERAHKMISSAVAANVRHLHNIHSPSFPSTRETFVLLEAEIYLALKNNLTNQTNKKTLWFPSLLCSWPWPWDTTLARKMKVDLGYRFLGKFCLPDAILSWLLCFFLRLEMQMEDESLGCLCLHFLLWKKSTFHLVKPPWKMQPNFSFSKSLRKPFLLF